ncbi:hypothetical protein BD770DRAFT_318583, partial [Pilaira anomala]
RMKYAVLSPAEFIPNEVFTEFPGLDSSYKVLLVNSIVVSQEGNWILVTQVEAYYHDHSIDDVSQINRHYEYPEKLEVAMEKCEMGKGTWYELRFRYQKLEFIATGGIFCEEKDKTKIGAFLGVAVPSHLTLNTNFLLFSLHQPTEIISCVRMLRNYKKKASLKKLCFKSLFFESIDFSTPAQLELYKHEPNGFISVCSKLLHLAIIGQLTERDLEDLERNMIEFRHYESLGFTSLPTKEAVMEQIEKISKKIVPVKLGKAKLTLIKLIVNRSLDISNQDLMLLYNEIISWKVKSLNRERVKQFVKTYQ